MIMCISIYIDIKLNTNENGYGTYLKFKDKTVYLEIGAKSKDYFIENIDRYSKTIIHELLHGFEDYNRIKIPVKESSLI